MRILIYLLILLGSFPDLNARAGEPTSPEVIKGLDSARGSFQALEPAPRNCDPANGYIPSNPGSQQGMWEPDEDAKNWNENRVYAEYAAWVSKLDKNTLENDYREMMNLAVCKCPEQKKDLIGKYHIYENLLNNPTCSNTPPKHDCQMADMLLVREWDCSATAAYLWLKFSFENKLPFTSGPVLFTGNGMKTEIELSHESKNFPDYSPDRYPGLTKQVKAQLERERFLLFAKLFQNMTYVQDFNERMTYPIQLKYLQAGTISFSNEHIRVISGVNPYTSTLVTGQWQYTMLGSAAEALQDLQPYAIGEKYGLRLFRLPYQDEKDKRWKLKPASKHKRYDSDGEQPKVGNQLLQKVFEANRTSLDPSIKLKLGSRIHESLVTRRLDYIARNPWDGKSTLESDKNWDAASTPRADSRFVTFCDDYLAAARQHPGEKIEIVTSRFTLPDQTEFQGRVPLDFYCGIFKANYPAISKPQNPRWPSLKELPAQILNREHTAEEERNLAHLMASAQQQLKIQASAEAGTASRPGTRMQQGSPSLFETREAYQAYKARLKDPQAIKKTEQAFEN